jgi:hypothetical protein
MRIKNVFGIFLMSIFVLGTISFCYADSGPNIGINQAKSIANSYLQSHNLPYKVTTATWMIYIKNKQTGKIKLVSVEKWDAMTGGNKERSADPNFLWTYADTTLSWWKVAIADPQGQRVGTIWINAETGKILKYTKITTGMQETGTPLTGLALAILMVLGGFLNTRKK